MKLTFPLLSLSPSGTGNSSDEPRGGSTGCPRRFDHVAADLLVCLSRLHLHPRDPHPRRHHPRKGGRVPSPCVRRGPQEGVHRGHRPHPSTTHCYPGARPQHPCRGHPRSRAHPVGSALRQAVRHRQHHRVRSGGSGPQPHRHPHGPKNRLHPHPPHQLPHQGPLPPIRPPLQHQISPQVFHQILDRLIRLHQSRRSSCSQNLSFFLISLFFCRLFE